MALLVVLVGTSLNGFAGNSASRKQQAREQFEKAEQMREALNGRPEEGAHPPRLSAGRRRLSQGVLRCAGLVSKADASVVAVAELLAEMGRQFQPDEKDLHAAIGEYEFLRREYPGSKYRVEALFTIGQIYKEDLGDDDAARKRPSRNSWRTIRTTRWPPRRATRWRN